jgi:hypothetical protein
MTEFEEFYMQYLNLGWNIFPLHYPKENGLCSCNKLNCSSPAKHPLTLHGFKDATIDIKQIKEWIKQYPNANWGIRTGKESNIVVLDVDVKKGGNESLIKNKYSNPITFTVSTGNGYHCYFELPKDIEWASGVNILTGVDIRANNGYVVAPPSKHINGSTYEIFCNEKLAYPPDWFCGIISKKQEQKGINKQKPDFFKEGERNENLFRIGLGFAYKQARNTKRLFAYLKATNKKRCNPPLPNFEILQITNNILNTKDIKTGKQLRFT